MCIRHRNVAFGSFYSAQQYYIYFSVPNVLTSNSFDVNNPGGESLQYGTESIHYFLTGGYVFDLNPNLKFKPSAMLKSAFNVPVSVDISANFLINEKFEIGAAYRLEDSVDFMVNYAITPNLKLGYAYDRIVSDLKVTTQSSHEIVLLLSLIHI